MANFAVKFINYVKLSYYNTLHSSIGAIGNINSLYLAAVKIERSNLGSESDFR